MTVPTAGLAGDTSVRDLLSSLSALQVLSMVMFDASGEEEIMDLAVSAVPSLGRDCRVEGVWLDGQWRAVTSPRGHLGCPAGLEDQLTLLGGVGGLLSSPGRGGCAGAAAAVVVSAAMATGSGGAVRLSHAEASTASGRRRARARAEAEGRRGSMVCRPRTVVAGRRK